MDANVLSESISYLLNFHTKKLVFLEFSFLMIKKKQNIISIENCAMSIFTYK